MKVGKVGWLLGVFAVALLISVSIYAKEAKPLPDLRGGGAKIVSQPQRVTGTAQPAKVEPHPTVQAIPKVWISTSLTPFVEGEDVVYNVGTMETPLNSIFTATDGKAPYDWEVAVKQGDNFIELNRDTDYTLSGDRKTLTVIKGFDLYNVNMFCSADKTRPVTAQTFCYDEIRPELNNHLIYEGALKVTLQDEYGSVDKIYIFRLQPPSNTADIKMAEVISLGLTRLGWKVDAEEFGSTDICGVDIFIYGVPDSGGESEIYRTERTRPATSGGFNEYWLYRLLSADRDPNPEVKLSSITKVKFSMYDAAYPSASMTVKWVRIRTKYYYLKIYPFVEHNWGTSWDVADADLQARHYFHINDGDEPNATMKWVAY